jgi:hypothetical protein
MSFSSILKKRLLSFLLSGTVLSSGLCQAQTPPPSAGNLQDEIQRQLKISHHKYTLQQATDRAVSALDGKYNYLNRNKKLHFLFSRCVQTDYTVDQVPKKAKDLWENMQTLKSSHTLLGPALADFSVKANVFYGHARLKSAVGMWTDQYGLVKVTKNKKYSQADDLLTQGHETIHGIQKSNGLTQEDKSWSIREFQMSMLSIEAAARVGEYLLALDLERDSIKAPWRALVKEDSTRSRKFRQDYDAVMAGNTPYAQALAAIGENEFYAQFKEQWWLNAYNDYLLRNYIEMLANGELEAPSGKKYGLESARKTGYISADFNFTACLDSLPSPQFLFGNNRRMQQAFAYVELKRLASTLGEKDPAYLKMLADLQKDQNPYLGVDLKQVQEVLSRQPDDNKVLKVMDTFVPKPKKPRTASQPRP